MMAAMEIEPEKFRCQYKVQKIFRVGGKNYGRSGFRKQQKFFRPYSLRKRKHSHQLLHIEFSQYKNSFINRCLFKY